MKKERKEKHFIQKPVFDGGTKAMKEFISSNMEYPKEALSDGLEGTVRVRFTIDYKGRVIEAHVLSGIGSGCDEEALRLVKLLRFQIAKVRNVKVQFHKTLNINFRLPKPQEESLSYSYHFVPAKPSRPEVKKDPKAKTTIIYRIGRSQ